jgi:hypothetical protein
MKALQWIVAGLALAVLVNTVVLRSEINRVLSSVAWPVSVR